jgi:hypothetical protein
MGLKEAPMGLKGAPMGLKGAPLGPSGPRKRERVQRLVSDLWSAEPPLGVEKGSSLAYDRGHYG